MATRARIQPSAAPDRQAALRQYRRRAPLYDFELAPFEAARRRAVARLQLQPGQTVLDLGCGTGLSFERLHRAVAPGGRIVGIEQSPQMIERARQRIGERGWTGVVLHEAPLASAPLPPPADAALLHFTHDLMREPQALRRVLARVKPGGRIVATGLKWTPWPLRNLLVLGAALHSVTTLAGLDAPWRGLEEWLGKPELETMFGGMVYLARWRVAPAARRRRVGASR